MAKKSRKSALSQCDDSSAKTAEITVSTLRQDRDLWYGIRVLLYDLSNLGSDPSAEKRLSSTTHEIYISAPYFTESEALKIRTALMDDTPEAAATEDQSASSIQDGSSSRSKKLTVEQTIHNRLEHFFDKRRAGGDSRPCGPHDMVPIYVSAFGIGKEELKDERFLSRLRKSGLGDSKSQQDGRGEDESSVKRKKKGGKNK